MSLIISGARLGQTTKLATFVCGNYTCGDTEGADSEDTRPAISRQGDRKISRKNMKENKDLKGKIED